MPRKAPGDLCWKSERIEDAIKFYEQVVEAWKSSTWMSYPPKEVPEVLTRLANVYASLGKLDDAYENYLDEHGKAAQENKITAIAKTIRRNWSDTSGASGK